MKLGQFRNICMPFQGKTKAKGEEKANRDNPKIKNRRNHMILQHIPKVNRDKYATSASPHFRPPLARRVERRPQSWPSRSSKATWPHLPGKATKRCQTRPEFARKCELPWIKFGCQNQA
jgi:hypothetical protein